MQTFKDLDSGQFWQFEDDVLVTGVDGARLFHAPNGAPLDVPSTMIVTELPPPADPPDPIPQAVVSRFQGREAMHRTAHGDSTLFDAAEAVLSREDTPAMYRRAWDDLQEFRRDSEMLLAVAGSLGLAPRDLDALFILAGSIKA
ncbi:hypothetical protein [Achromobacter sp. UBA2119]|uniref:hypothetical protein n=1 Tax=Achromobacter sp. UBA2119 TaxID=1945911 RepID=UPI00257A576C|nr:hypothetical protein [Achromobacter sp. UBA2119]